MTLVEARDILQGECLGVDCLSVENPDEITPMIIKTTNANYLAIEALERLIPVPPFDKEFPIMSGDIFSAWFNGAIVHYCPRCGEELELHPNFCEECGQAIDWSDWSD